MSTTPPTLTLSVELPDLSPDALRDAIIDRAVDRICGTNRRRRDEDGDEVDAWDSAIHADIRKAVSARVGEAINANVDRAVAEVLNKGFHTYTWDGRPDGPATTLREMVIKQLGIWLGQRVQSDGRLADSYTRDADTRIRQIVASNVADVFNKELAPQVKHAAAEIRVGLVHRLGSEVLNTVVSLLKLPSEYGEAAKAAIPAPTPAPMPPLPPAIPSTAIATPDAPAPVADDDVPF